MFRRGKQTRPTSRIKMMLAGLCLVGSALMLVPLAASAADTEVRIQVGPPPPPDMCTNIDGPQATVPEGMQVDADGNCYTPAPPPPPDACPNLSGNQSSIPSGYYQNDAGDCVAQTTPPQDVCPNLPGLQTTVPTGRNTDADGNCVEPPVDTCPNIPGPQANIPAGMQKNDAGECYTPAPIRDEPVANPPPAVVTGPRTPKNVPTFLAPVVQPLIDLVPEQVKEAVKQVPPAVAKTVPYYLFAVLGASAVVMMMTAIREAVGSRRLYGILKREKLIAEEKDNFLALSSHYLHTPLTIMRNGTETIVALQEKTAEALQPLTDSINSLKLKIDAILEDVESNKALKGIEAPNIAEAETRILRSPFFWLPVILAGSIALLSNFLLGVVAEIELGNANLWTQLVVFATVSALLYSTLRSRHLRKREARRAQLLIEHEHAIDSARNGFIQKSTQALREGLADVETQRHFIDDAPSRRFFDEGYQRFTSMLAKFTFLSAIESGASGAMTDFDIRQAVNDSLVLHQEQIDEKKLIITNEVEDRIISQNRILFGFVLNSVIDNAIKFSNESGAIIIKSHPTEGSLDISISDSGIGIPSDKLPHLFKPFSRVDSAVQFDYEGMGFSLFLGKIIMDYLGGDITATSAKDNGTTIELHSILSTATPDSSQPRIPAAER